MSDDTRRLHLRFSMQRPEQKKAFEIISAIPTGRRMEYLCGLINRETRLHDLEQHITNAVRKALSDYQPQIKPSKEENATEEIRGDIMDFLASL
jgi:ATP-dependent Lon protease